MDYRKEYRYAWSDLISVEACCFNFKRSEKQDRRRAQPVVSTTGVCWLEEVYLADFVFVVVLRLLCCRFDLILRSMPEGNLIMWS